jgi:hypothetical protein
LKKNITQVKSLSLRRVNMKNRRMKMMMHLDLKDNKKSKTKQCRKSWSMMRMGGLRVWLNSLISSSKI